MVAYPNLAAEIAKRGIKKNAIAKRLGICDKALCNKLKGRTPFTWPEVRTIRNEFFPDIPPDIMYVKKEEHNMALAPKVENFCAHKKTRSVIVDANIRACINCIWYEQYYRENRGNIHGFVPACAGYCLLHDQSRGPLRQPCKDYETKENPTRC